MVSEIDYKSCLFDLMMENGLDPARSNRICDKLAQEECKWLYLLFRGF